MPKRSLSVVLAPPGGPGLASALASHVFEGAVVTSWSDSLLVSARSVWPEGLEPSILPWGSLVRRMAQYAGIAAPRLPSTGHQRALVSLASRQLGEETAFERSCRLPGAHPLLVSALGELRGWSLGADGMRDAAGRASPDLRERLLVLARLDELVRDSLDAGRMGYATDIVRACMEAGPPKSWPCTQLVVLAGLEPHPVYEAFVGWLATCGLPVVVVVEAFAEEPGLFRPAMQLVGRLKARANPALGPDWHRCLFSGRQTAAGPKLRLLVAGEPLAEAEWALRAAASPWIEHGGATALLAPSLERYGPLLLASARRLGIRLAATLPMPLASTGLARFVERLLQALAIQDAGLLQSLVDEDYLAVRPEGARPPRLGADFQALLSDDGPGVPAWVETALRWLRSVPERTSLREWLDAFRALVGEVLAGASHGGQGLEGQRDSRAMTLLQRSLAEYAFAYDIAGEEQLTFAQFTDLAHELWLAESIVQSPAEGGIPVYSDPWMLGSCETLVVLGSVEGSFPKGARQDPVLADSHRLELAEVAQCALQTSRERAAGERDSFVRLCGCARHELVLARPRLDGDRPFMRALYTYEAERALGHAEAWEPPSLAPEAVEASLAADRRLRAALDGLRTHPAEPRLVTGEAFAAVSLGEGEPLDIGEVYDYRVCPLRSAFRNRIGLRPPVRPGTRALLRLPVETGLPGAHDLDEAAADLERALEALLARYAPSAQAYEIALLRATGKRWIETWIRQEAQSRLVWQRDSADGPVEFGSEELRGRLQTAPGEFVEVTGKVAAVIKAGKHRRAVIYRRRNLTGGRTSAEEEAEATQDAIVAYALSRKGHDTYLEVDTVADGRRVDSPADAPLSDYLPRGADALAKGKVASGLDLSAALRQTAAELRELVSDLRVGALRANPGEHCGHCPVYELCRWGAR